MLKAALQELKDVPSCDFGKHIIPHCHQNGAKVVAYDFKGYWKDVGTLGSYWEANMELVDIIPEFNLYEEFWKDYEKKSFEDMIRKYLGYGWKYKAIFLMKKLVRRTPLIIWYRNYKNQKMKKKDI